MIGFRFLDNTGVTKNRQSLKSNARFSIEMSESEFKVA